MSVGQGERIGGLGYLAISRETAQAAYVTCTNELLVLSQGFKTSQDSKVIEEIHGVRTHSHHIRLGKMVEGSVEGVFYPRSVGCGWMLQNAFGGTITDATATNFDGTADTAGTSAYMHTIEVGDMDNTYTGLSFNQRKGDSASGQIYEYRGFRINEFTLKAELDEPLKYEAAMVGFDSTLTSNDVSSNFTAASADWKPLNFTSGRISVEGTFASLTSSSFWEVQSIEFGMNNNLKSDTDSRRIGSDILDVLPAGMLTFTLQCNMRFDTSTAFDDMIADTSRSLQLEFLGDTMPGSLYRYGIRLDFPKVLIKDAGDPEVGGPDEILKSDVTFEVLRDESSAGGYAVRAVLFNTLSAI